LAKNRNTSKSSKTKKKGMVRKKRREGKRGGKGKRQKKTEGRKKRHSKKPNLLGEWGGGAKESGSSKTAKKKTAINAIIEKSGEETRGNERGWGVTASFPILRMEREKGCLIDETSKHGEKKEEGGDKN